MTQCWPEAKQDQAKREGTLCTIAGGKLKRNEYYYIKCIYSFPFIDRTSLVQFLVTYSARDTKDRDTFPWRLFWVGLVDAQARSIVLRS